VRGEHVTSRRRGAGRGPRGGKRDARIRARDGEADAEWCGAALWLWTVLISKSVFTPLPVNTDDGHDVIIWTDDVGTRTLE